MREYPTTSVAMIAARRRTAFIPDHPPQRRLDEGIV
jgi:hypothetical protein